MNLAENACSDSTSSKFIKLIIRYKFLLFISFNFLLDFTLEKKLIHEQ